MSAIGSFSFFRVFFHLLFSCFFPFAFLRSVFQFFLYVVFFHLLFLFFFFFSFWRFLYG